MKSPVNPRSILVIQLKHLGDVLLSTPVIDALATRYPEAKIYALVNSGMEVMLTGNPNIAGIFTLPPHIRESRGVLRFKKEWNLLVQVRRKRFGLVINLSRGDRGGWLSILSGARHRLCYKVASQEASCKNWFYNLSVDQPTGSIHEVEKNLGLLAALDFKPERLPLAFSIPGEIKDWAKNEMTAANGKKIAHIHPTSRWMFKCWNAERIGEVIGRLQSAGWFVVMTCGPGLDEIKHVQSILHHAAPDLIYKGKLNLKQLGALIGLADVFLGVDSAPMHIAAAVRTPTVALFGPTGSENWSPWLVRSEVLQKRCPCKEARAEKCDWTKGSVRQCLSEITSDEVFAAVTGLDPTARD